MPPDSPARPSALRRLFPCTMTALLAGAGGWWFAGQPRDSGNSGNRQLGNAGRPEPGVRRAAAKAAQATKASGNARALATMELVFGERADFLQRVAAAGAADLPELHREFQGMPERDVSTHLAELALFRRWVEIDPAGGLAWIRKNDLNRTTLLLTVWARRDPAAADAGVAAEGGNGSMNSYDPKFSASAAELKRMLEYSLIEKPGGLAFFAPNSNLWTLATLDPATAKELYARIPAESQETAASRIAQHLPGDPREALAWAGSLPPGKTRQAAMAAALRKLAWKEPDEALALAREHGLEKESMDYLNQQLAAGYAGKGAAALLGFLEQLDDGKEINIGIGDLAAGSASMADLHRLLAAAQRHEVSVSYSDIDWSGRDMGADLRAVSTMPPGAHKTKLLDSLLRFGEDHGIELPFESPTALPEEARAAVAARIAADRFAAGDYEGAEPYLEIADPTRVLNASGEFSHPKTMEVITAMIHRLPGEQQEKYWEMLAGLMGSFDPDAADALVSTLPEAQQPAAWTGLVGSLAKTDPSAAADRVNTLPPGPVRDAAISGLTDSLSGMDAPEEALPWALAITDEALRLKTLTEVAAEWLRQDPVAAAAQLPAMDLPTAEREAVERIMR